MAPAVTMEARSVELGASRSLAEHVAGFGPLYVLLDAAHPMMLRRLEESGELFQSLYAGRRARAIRDVAPYLAQVSTGSPLLEEFAHRWLGGGRALLLAARSPLADVRRHLRRWLTVELPGGEAVAFRFWDPRVLRPFLASATPDEAHAFCGPITAFFFGDIRDPGRLLVHDRVGPAAPAPSPPWDLPRIRAEQCEALSEDLEARFRWRCVNGLHLSSRMPRADAEAVVAAAMSDARRRGLTSEGEVSAWISLVATLGLGFDERLAWARGILTRGDLDTGQKLRRLERALRRRAPSAARHGDDPR
jgi:hypothetical protein